MSTIDSKGLHDRSKATVHGLRRALSEILTSVGADSSQPQEMSRRFGLDKTLTWRIARVVREEDALEAVPHIPRKPSMRLFLTAMERSGASNAQVESVWKALSEFEQFI